MPLARPLGKWWGNDIPGLACSSSLSIQGNRKVTAAASDSIGPLALS
jgi:hypothetical protein